MITWPVGSELRIDGDRIRRRADELAVAASRVDRQDIAVGVDVVGAVVEVPGRAAVLGDQEADAWSSRVVFATGGAAGGGDDDRVIRVRCCGGIP